MKGNVGFCPKICRTDAEMYADLLGSVMGTESRQTRTLNFYSHAESLWTTAVWPSRKEMQGLPQQSCDTGFVLPCPSCAVSLCPQVPALQAFTPTPPLRHSVPSLLAPVPLDRDVGKHDGVTELWPSLRELGCYQALLLAITSGESLPFRHLCEIKSWG